MYSKKGKYNELLLNINGNLEALRENVGMILDESHTGEIVEPLVHMSIEVRHGYERGNIKYAINRAKDIVSFCDEKLKKKYFGHSIESDLIAVKNISKGIMGYLQEYQNPQKQRGKK
jgi:hypothetical protein